MRATVEAAYPHLLTAAASRQGLSSEIKFDYRSKAQVTLRGGRSVIESVLKEYGYKPASIRWHD